MKPRTNLNQKIESMIATMAKPLVNGTQRIGVYIFSNGHQIAIQREDIKEINIWTEIFDTNDINLQSTRRTYESKDTRSSNLKGNAPNLMQPNRVYQFKFDTKKIDPERIAKQVESLLDRYKKQPFTIMQGDNSIDSLLKPNADLIRDLDSGLSETLAVITAHDQFLYTQVADTLTDEPVDSSSYMNDVEKKTVVERFAVDRAVSFYECEGFHVEEKGKPYDLLCIKGDLIVHVEVKGSSGSGRTVILTVNEVNDAKSPDWRSDLFIVYGIKLDLVDGKWVGTGGTTRHLKTWCPLEKDMKAIQFEYAVPQPL